MNADSYFKDYFANIGNKIQLIDSGQLLLCAEFISKTAHNGRKLLVMGNGGSAAMASHVCVDFLKAASIRAVNFNEADLITCFGNDYGYAHWVEKALEGYADAGDLAIIISSSGRSDNMINAAIKARDMGLSIITVTGFSADNPLRVLGDINLWVDSNAYNVVEMTHHVWLLAIVDYLTAIKNIEKDKDKAA